MFLGGSCVVSQLLNNIFQKVFQFVSASFLSLAGACRQRTFNLAFTTIFYFHISLFLGFYTWPPKFLKQPLNFFLWIWSLFVFNPIFLCLSLYRVLIFLFNFIIQSKFFHVFFSHSDPHSINLFFISTFIIILLIVFFNPFVLLIFFPIISFNVWFVRDWVSWFFWVWCFRSNNPNHRFEKLMHINIVFCLFSFSISSFDVFFS